MNVFEEVLAEVLAKDPRYDREAYVFAQEALDHAVELREQSLRSEIKSESAEPQHTSGGELCEAFRDLAFLRFGMLAREVLAGWGLKSTRDLGNIVFNLIEVGAMRKHDEDRIEDFENRFEFEEAFRTKVSLI